MPTMIELELRPGETDPAALRAAAARRLGIAESEIAEARCVRRAIDARGRVRLHVTVEVVRVGEVVQPEAPLERPRLREVERRGPPVVIVGAGPAGLFAALRLAERGIDAVVLDRGKRVQPRRRDLASLNKDGVVDPESNYCFGEGGAGTYSDGKLYTRATKRGPVRTVLETLVAHGAAPEILVDARPHVGSNRLPRVVTALRETIESAGIAVRFETRVVDILKREGRAAGVRLAGGEEIAASAVIVASGHSARDVYDLLVRAGVALEAKAFALGVRVEHPQPLIDAIQYGRDAGHPDLPAAAYRLTTQVAGRGVFSFCMCPGGWIVPATTESDAVVTNGMSLSRRDSPFANSGIVASIEPGELEALGHRGALAGIAFQAEVERLAARLGGGDQKAPAQGIADFLAGREPRSLPRSSYRPGLTAAPLHDLLPSVVVAPLRAALERFRGAMRGFDSREGIAVAVESRTSSPVRVPRDEASLESPTLAGLHPCGEGAGYAGGIVSAALDGLRVAEAIATRR